MGRFGGIREVLIAFVVAAAASGCASTPGRETPLEPIFAVAVSPDGRTIAVTTAAEEVALFNVDPLRFRMLLTPEGQKAAIRFDASAPSFRSPPIAVSGDSRLVVAAGIAGQISGWDLESGSVRFRVALPGLATDIAFAHDASEFFVASGSIRRHRAADGALLGEMSAPSGASVTSIAVSSGSRLYAGLSDGRIAEFDLSDGNARRVIAGHARAVTGIAVSPDGSSFATNSGRFDPVVWDAAVDPPARRQSPYAGGPGQALASSGSTAEAMAWFAWIVGTSAGWRLVGAPTMGASPATRPAPSDSSLGAPTLCGARVTYSSNGRYLATTANLSRLDGELHLLIADLERHVVRRIDGIYSCVAAFSTDGRYIVTGGLGAPQVWNVETGKLVESAH